MGTLTLTNGGDGADSVADSIGRFGRVRTERGNASIRFQSMYFTTRPGATTIAYRRRFARLRLRRARTIQGRTAKQGNVRSSNVSPTGRIRLEEKEK